MKTTNFPHKALGCLAFIFCLCLTACGKKAPASYAERLLERPSVSTVGVAVSSDVPSPFARQITRMVQKRLSDRSNISFVPSSSVADLTIELQLDTTLSAEAYRIKQSPGTVLIAGADPAGILYGVGRFLHTSGFHQRQFHPSQWSGTSVPTSTLRGIYFATHFFNWYQQAPAEVITEYIEDLALWGYNAMLVVYPVINLYNFSDPEVDKTVEQMDKMFSAAEAVAMKVGMLFCANADFKSPDTRFSATPNPDPLGRRGNNGHNVCPNKPGATEYILKNIDDFYQKISTHRMDLLCLWPYDEGGCACEACYPWGVKGYLPLCERIASLARRYNPRAKVIVSTWMFDTPEEGEWAHLSHYFDQGKGEWIDYLMADAHEDFPRYPLEHAVPGNRPLINFPEISMWGLSPWGGYGANPLPERFERLWSQVKERVSGGFPYSEGNFEDLNKVLISEFYWNREADAATTLCEYIGYEYDLGAVDSVVQMIRGIEQNHTRYETERLFDLDTALRVWNTAQAVDNRLPQQVRQAWRWRILYLRAQLDYIRYSLLQTVERKNLKEALNQNPQAVEAMRELVKINHNFETDDGTYPQHSWIRPPLTR